MNTTTVTDTLTDTKPEEAGIPSASLLAFLKRLEECPGMEVHSLQLLRHGKRVLDCNWHPYNAKRFYTLFSLTKTFTSTAVGFAFDEGLLKLEDKVVSFFPEYAHLNMDSKMKDMTIHHLLTMTSGYFENISGCGVWSQMKGSWVKTFLGLPLSYSPGEKFVYNSGSTHMASSIVSKVTGMPVKTYLTKKLFEPLGIGPVMWDADIEGNNAGGWGLNLSTEDIAKVGQFYLQTGRWGDRQLLSEEWIKRATHHQVTPAVEKKNRDYGYCIWLPPDGSYCGSGAFGQIFQVFPEHDMVLAATMGVQDDAVHRLMGDKKQPGFLAQTVLENLSDSSLPYNDDAYRDLQAFISTRSLPVSAYGIEPEPYKGTSRFYWMEENDENIKGIHIEFYTNQIEFAFIDDDGRHVIHCGKGDWHIGKTDMPGNVLHHYRYFPIMDVAGTAAWTDESTLELKWAFLNMPFVDTITCRFIENKLVYQRSVNINSPNTNNGATMLPAIRGNLR